MTAKVKKKYVRRTGKESGASILEAMISLCFMCFLFFALLQIYQWCNAKLFCRYASYFGAKGRALGYKTNFILRAVRVAAAPVSGSRHGASSGSELTDLQNYMVDGDGSGIWYKYWYPRNRTQPMIILRGTESGNNIMTTVTLRNAPFISDELGKLMSVSVPPSPAGSGSFYDYSAIYLE